MSEDDLSTYKLYKLFIFYFYVFFYIATKEIYFTNNNTVD